MTSFVNITWEEVNMDPDGRLAIQVCWNSPLIHFVSVIKKKKVKPGQWRKQFVTFIPTLFVIVSKPRTCVRYFRSTLSFYLPNIQKSLKQTKSGTHSCIDHLEMKMSHPNRRCTSSQVDCRLQNPQTGLVTERTTNTKTRTSIAVTRLVWLQSRQSMWVHWGHSSAANSSELSF